MDNQEKRCKVAVVTGAGRGIGRAIAIQLAKQGNLVIVNYNGSKAKAEAVVEEIKNMGGNAAAYGCNVSDYDAAKAMFDWVIKEYGSIDILVNNAGITRDMLILKMTEDDFDSVIATNLKGAYNCIKHVTRQMLSQKSGRIINMSSVVGLSGNAGQINYSASKAGVIGLTKSAAKELGSRGITVNAVAPGYIDTDMTKVLPDKIKEEIISQIPLRRMGVDEDVAKLVAFLASDNASYITGQVISVDGGMHI